MRRGPALVAVSALIACAALWVVFARFPAGVPAVDGSSGPGTTGTGEIAVRLTGPLPERVEPPAPPKAADDASARGTIVGLVVDDLARPVASAHVSVWTAREGERVGSATTGPDGRFELTHTLPANALVRLVAEAEGHLAAEATVRLGSPVTLRMRRRRGEASIAGRVVCPDGAPVEEFRLAWRAEGGARKTLGPIRDPYGRFEIKVDVPVGKEIRGTLEAWAPEEGGGRVEVRLLPEQASAEVAIVLRAGEKVRGRVEDPDGRPVEGARVEFYRPPLVPGLTGPVLWPPDRAVATDREGRFIFASEPDVPVLGISVRAEGFAPYRRVGAARLAEIRDAAGLLRVRLERGARIEGIVLLVDGRPAPGCAVSLVPDEGTAPSGSFLAVTQVLAAGGGRPGESPSGRWTRTGSDGRFAFEGVGTGGYLIEAWGIENSVRGLRSPQERLSVGHDQERGRPLRLVLGEGRTLEVALDLEALSFLRRGRASGSEPRGSYLECRLYDPEENGGKEEGDPGRLLAVRGFTADRPVVRFVLPPDLPPGRRLLRLVVNPLLFLDRSIEDRGSDSRFEIRYTEEEVRALLLSAPRARR